MKPRRTAAIYRPRSNKKTPARGRGYIFLMSSYWVNNVEAVCAICSVLVSVFTLFYLVRYAYDTKRLANDTKRLADIAVRQIDETSVPYLTVRWIPQGALVPGKDYHSSGSWYVLNVGRGPALNLSAIGKKADGSPLEGQDAVQHRMVQMDDVADVIVDAPMRLGPGSGSILSNGLAIELTYNSLTGLRYRSLITQIGRYQSKVIFANVSAS